MIVVIDYGVGNVRSIANMIEYLGFEPVLGDSAAVISKATYIILPGVGAFDRAMNEIGTRNLLLPLHEAVINKRIPILGVCLGMQLLAEGSDEGRLPGLGWIGGRARALRSMVSSETKVPHVGWNVVRPTRSSRLFPFVEPERFYFTHGFAVQCDAEVDVSARTSHGVDFCCAVEKENIFGVQFHPEKSHKYGMRLLQRFFAVEGE